MTQTKPLPFDCPVSFSEGQFRFSSKMSLTHFQQQALLA